MKTLLNLIYLVSIVCAQDWNYDDQEEWASFYKQCNGTSESPINIDTKIVKENSSLTINFINYDKCYHFMAQNNGHTVRVFPTINDVNRFPYITGSSVNNDKFNLDSFHFHWGETDNNGTEHSIDNIKRSMELHLVHWNQRYGNMSNARDRVDGLAVVTVFYEVSNRYNRLDIDNIVLSPIINALSRIKEFGSNTTIKELICLDSLLPSNKYVFYRYKGSLTTPPCSETATFIIFADINQISHRQVSEFRKLKGEPENGTSEPLTHNTREQQKLNGRIVEVSHKDWDILSKIIEIVQNIKNIF